MKNALFAIITMLNVNYCFAGVIVNIFYDYYGFIAEDKQELVNAAFSATTIRENGKKFLGYTAWRYDWNYRYKSNQEGCFITKLTTDVTIKITLPKLISNNLTTRKIFEKFIQKLNIHEQNHANIAIRYGYNLDKAVSQIVIQSDCDKLISLINQTANYYVNEAQLASRQYDKNTNHGATEGAILRNE